MQIYGEKKFNKALYISVLLIIIALIVVFFIMYKYTVEGEAIPPFQISKMVVVSSAKTQDIEIVENGYSTKVVQNNDIKIAIEKNPEYKKEAIIRKITINNIQIDKKNSIGNIEIYRPSQEENKLYEYQEQYKIKDKIEYEGAQETYSKGEKLQIANQGGIIDFSVILNDLGTTNYTENELNVDGTLLKNMGISNEQISFEMKFDLIVELENDIKLKTKITLDLPTGNILEEGIETLEQTDMKTIFKRI